MFPCGSLHIVITTRGVIIWVELESCCTLWPTNWHEVYEVWTSIKCEHLTKAFFFFFFFFFFYFKKAWKTSKEQNPKAIKEKNKGCFTMCGLCHFTLKNLSILRQREELLKLKYFTMQKYNLPKKKKKSSLKKKNQNLVWYFNSIYYN